MIFSRKKEFTILFLSEHQVQACCFRKDAGRFRLKAYATEKQNSADPAEVCRRVLHEVGYGKDCPLIVSCAMKDGVFFRCSGAYLSSDAMRSALEFEVPRRLLHEPEECVIQFLPLANETEGNEEIPVNVYAFPGAGMQSLAAVITQSIRKADFFLYPLIALRKEDGAVFLPEIEPDFYFEQNEWHPIKDLTKENWLEYWKNEFKAEFQLPSDDGFRIKDYLHCLLPARLAASSVFRENIGGLNILPKQLRPSRLRNQLTLMVFLIFLLCLNFFWGIFGMLSKNYKEYTSLNAERGRLMTEVRTTGIKLKASEKENRELARIVNLEAGEHDVIGKLAGFSALLPQNVMVMSLRWTESGIDVTMRSEAQNLNLPQLLLPLKHWKVSQLQQRRRGNETASMITMKLIPAEANKK